MMKRTLALLLALLLLAAPSALAQSRWADVYADFLAKNTMTEVEKAYLADLNLDGTPELIAQTGRNLVFHTVQNDALKALGALQGDTPPSGMMLALFRAKNAYRWISYIEEPSGDKSILELSLQNGQLMYKSRFSYDHAGGQSHFFVGMRETSEAKFTKALTAYEKTLGNAIIGAVESAPGVLPAAQMERMAADWEKLAVDAIPAKSLSLKPAKKTLAFGDTFSLNAAVKPASATGKITWTSDNETLVAVDETGDLLVVGYEGTANITAAINGHSKTCKITVVRPKPETVTIKGDLWAQVGGTCQLTATVEPIAAHQEVAWTSSDENVVRVSDTGLVTGLAAGTSIITAATGKILSRVLLTVGDPDGVQTGSVTRRGVIVGGTHIPEQEGQFRNTVYQMRNAFNQPAFGGAGRMSTSVIINESSGETVLTKIADALKGADADDVSYLYINCHGGKASDFGGEYVLCIGSAYSKADRSGMIKAAQLRDALDAIPGKIVLIVESCYSGDLIGKGTSGANFAEGFMKVFVNRPVSKAGELAKEKYYVLTGSSLTQSSMFLPVSDPEFQEFYGIPLMSEIVSRGIGWHWDYTSDEGVGQGDWLADADENGQVTLTELYDYTWPTVRDRFFAYGYDQGSEYTETGFQHVQVWPENSDFAVFEK